MKRIHQLNCRHYVWIEKRKEGSNQHDSIKRIIDQLRDHISKHQLSDKMCQTNFLLFVEDI